MARLAAQYPDLHCVIIGEGRLHDTLADQIARAGLAERVHLLGYREPEETLRIMSRSEAQLVADGDAVTELPAGGTVTICRSPFSTQLIRLNDAQPFFGVLQEKLNWAGA